MCKFSGAFFELGAIGRYDTFILQCMRPIDHKNLHKYLKKLKVQKGATLRSKLGVF